MSKRIFFVQGSAPPAPGKTSSHVRQHVIATSLVKAVALVEEKFPGVTIHNVQHHGVVDIEES